MKRCIRRLRNLLVNLFREMSIWEKILIVIGGVIGVIVAVKSYTVIDTVPATLQDYKELEEQALNVQENPQLIFETICEMKVKEETIEIEFENDDSKIVAEYNKAFELLSISRTDKFKPFIFPLVGAILIGFITCYCFVLFILTVIMILESIILKVTNVKIDPKNKK